MKRCEILKLTKYNQFHNRHLIGGESSSFVWANYGCAPKGFYRWKLPADSSQKIDMISGHETQEQMLKADISLYAECPQGGIFEGQGLDIWKG